MTFKQIREIKAKFAGLTLNPYQTYMFNNTQWASLWKINFLMKSDIENLFKYLDDKGLSYFFGRAGLHIQ